jgi:hypothetical protein
MLAYTHGIVDGINAVYLAVILLCTTTLFVTVKYRFSKLVSIKNAVKYSLPVSIFNPLSGNAPRCALLYYFTLSNAILFYSV